MSCCSSEILEAVNEYYKLKDKYESKITKDKQKILSITGLSKKEKHARYARVKKLCVNCNRDGGTLFSNKNRVLKAICGVTSSPCKLDIEIQLGEYDSKLNIFDYDKQYKNQSELDIIKIKLDLLFKFIEESEAVQQYQNKKNIYLEEQKDYHSLLTDILMITDNTTKFNNLNDSIISLYEHVETLKELHKLYNSEEKPEIIKEMIDLYNSKILPNADRIRNLMYAYNNVDEKEDGTYELIQKPYTLFQLEMNNGNKEKIIKNNR
jgi:hypothetical protein